MNKKEYMIELRRRLKVLPESERQDALEYYEEYLDDAGKNEKNAIKKLGTPAEVAAKILGESAVKQEDTPNRKQKRGLRIALVTTLAIFAAPIGLPLAIAAVAVIFSLLVTLIALIVAFGTSGVAVIIAGVVYIPVSIIALIQHTGTGLAMLGIGFVAIGIGILLTGMTITLARVGFDGISRLAGKTILRKEAR